MIGKHLRELRTPFVKDLAVHIHQQGHRTMPRGDQIQSGLGALGVVSGDALETPRGLGTREVADGAQLLDQVGFTRSSRAGDRRRKSRLTISSVRLTVDATAQAARERAE